MRFHHFNIILKNPTFSLKHVPTLRRRNHFTVGIPKLEPCPRISGAQQKRCYTGHIARKNINKLSMRSSGVAVCPAQVCPVRSTFGLLTAEYSILSTNLSLTSSQLSEGRSRYSSKKAAELVGREVYQKQKHAVHAGTHCSFRPTLSPTNLNDCRLTTNLSGSLLSNFRWHCIHNFHPDHIFDEKSNGPSIPNVYLCVIKDNI